MKSFGAVIKEQREKRGYNQKQFAELIGVTPTRLNYWEKDKREPDVPNIKKILKGLDIAFEELASMTDDPTPYADTNSTILNPEELPVIQKYRRLNDSGKEYIGSQLDFALGIDKYRAQEQTEDKKHTALDEYRAHPPIIMGMAAFGGESSMETVSEEEHARRKASLENYRKNR